MKRTLTNADVFQLMESWAPKHLAYDWDNVGLQIGSYEKPVKKIMVTLDVMENVVDEAIENDVDLIIAHHPILFKPLKQINLDSTKGRIVQKLLANQISVYASHTNLDIARGGVNDMLCNALNINIEGPLQEVHAEQLFKLAVFVPKTHVRQVMDALSEHGAGHIGNYSHCTFQSAGYGTFKPLEGTNPFIGSENQLEQVEEVKLETIVQESIVNQVVNAMINQHPYEEVAYDIVPLKNKGTLFGIGRIGKLSETMSLETLCSRVKTSLDIPSVRVTGDLKKRVKKIAVLGGSGEGYIHAAKQKGADVYITGDMTFHQAQDAWAMGLSVIDPGHHVEKVMKTGVKSYLEQRLKHDHVEIITSNANTEPFQFL